MAITRLGGANAISGTIPAANIATLTSSNLPTGSVIQTVQATTTTETIVSSTTYTDTTLSGSITPSSASSKILILVQQPMDISRSNTSNYAGIRLLRGSTVIFDPNVESSTGPSHVGIVGGGLPNVRLRTVNNFSYIDSPSTTSQITYKTQGRPFLTTSSGQVRFQVDGGTNDQSAIITLMEIVG